MVMVLCLFIYSMTEFWLRRRLQETGETVTGQTKKQTQRPTLKWTFFLFRGPGTEILVKRIDLYDRDGYGAGVVEDTSSAQVGTCGKWGNNLKGGEKLL